jgi:outer membrane protein
MFRKVFLGLPLLLVSAGLLAAEAGPAGAISPVNGVTLQQCFQRAQHISETLGISEESIRLVQEQYRERLGAILPHIDWIKSQFYQQGISFPASNGATSSSLLTVQPLSYFQLQQPLFSGGRDWAALKASKSLRNQAQYNRDTADLQLLSDVSTSFYTAFTLSDQLGVLMETRKLTGDRVGQLQHWVNLGRSREAEVLTAQTDLASQDALIESTKQSYAESRQLLSFLTEISTAPALVDDRIVTPSLSLDEALTRADRRPDIMAAVEAVNQADLQHRYAQGGHWPTLGLTGRYYTERAGFLSDVRWDATFLLDVPLFEGGSTQAQVLEARSQQIITQLMLARLKRDVERQVRTAYDDLTYSLSQVQAYDKAVDLAVKNYATEEKEYRLGLITNIELLQLLSNMQDIKRLGAAAHAALKLNDIRLRIAMGEGL